VRAPWQYVSGWKKSDKKFLGGTMSTTEITPAMTSPSDRNSKRRKAKAILAGGLVLGIGAAVTLAAWNDSEFAFGEFGSGQFNVEGSTNGTTFSEHGSADAADRADLAFTANYNNMSPGDTVAAPYALRLDELTSYGASVVVDSATAGGDAVAVANLTYRIIKVNSFADCTSTANGTIVASGPDLGAEQGVTPFTLVKPEKVAGANAPGAATNVCIQVTAGENLPQGAAATATWKFVATSVS
jgi:predicted ribosomally synthesized peptide with SipW-like signal peptide